MHYFYCYIHPGLKVFDLNLRDVAEIRWMSHPRFALELVTSGVV